MKILIAACTTLSLLLLAAHGVRGGDFGTAAAVLLLAGMVFLRRAWLRPVVFALLGAAAWTWTSTGLSLVRMRMGLGMDWIRLAVILASVAALSLASMWMAGTRPGRDFFSTHDKSAAPRAAAFLLTAGLLILTRSMVSFPILLADRFFPGWGMLEVFGLALYASMAGGAMLDPKTDRKLRPLIWGGFSLVFFLQLALGLSGMEMMLMTGSLHLPVPALIIGGPLYRGGGLFMLILFTVAVLLVGPAWCSRLCYIGAWDDGMSRIKGIKPGANLGKLPIMGRAATLILVAAGALLLRFAGVPGIAAVIIAAGFGLAGVGVMVFVSRKKGVMVHCSAYCPMGLVANLLGKLSPWRMRMSTDCTKCGICINSCRYSALSTADIEHGRPGTSCTLCGDCVGGCPHSAMEYRFPGLKPKTARTVFIVLTISLHALFLGVARI